MRQHSVAKRSRGTFAGVKGHVATRIFLYNVHLALFVRMDDAITCTNASVSSSFSKLEIAEQMTSTIIANWERKDLRFRRGSPLACRVMGIACSRLSSFI